MVCDINAQKKKDINIKVTNTEMKAMRKEQRMKKEEGRVDAVKAWMAFLICYDSFLYKRNIKTSPVQPNHISQTLSFISRSSHPHPHLISYSSQFHLQYRKHNFYVMSFHVNSIYKFSFSHCNYDRPLNGVPIGSQSMSWIVSLNRL